jgi:hypothetical protein
LYELRIGFVRTPNNFHGRLSTITTVVTIPKGLFDSCNDTFGEFIGHFDAGFVLFVALMWIRVFPFSGLLQIVGSTGFPFGVGDGFQRTPFPIEYEIYFRYSSMLQ